LITLSHRLNYSQKIIRNIIKLLNKKQINQFHEIGYLVFKVKKKEYLNKIKKELLKNYSNLKINKNNLEKKYSKIVKRDRLHHNYQKKFQKIIKDRKIHYKIIENYKEYFQKILGLDICCTTSVNFRSVRPNKDADNIGFHRDTDLGHTPYELNVWVPLFNTNKRNTLFILPESHKRKLDYYKSEKIKTSFKKGSKQNRLGYLYKAFKFKNNIEKKMRAVPCKFGEILIFYSSCMHGTKMNNSDKTRFSIDYNISNSYYPIKWKHHGNETKYKKIVYSNVSNNAESMKD